MNQTTCKEGDVSVSNGGAETLPLLGDLVLYYCRHADQPVLVQLYQAEVRGHAHTHTHTHTHTATVSHSSEYLCEISLVSPSTQLTLAGGERRREVFIHSLELGHTAGTRAVKAMGESPCDAPRQPQQHADKHTHSHTNSHRHTHTHTHIYIYIYIS